MTTLNYRITILNKIRSMYVQQQRASHVLSS